ncbi:TetR/AcrR family transcriptional regulator [Ornithinibacillus halophilus]|uniref:Transcriptional regulator, TetR family n=1 Tax=Ornithinibacillus halophilus TaxID=930117 RepID=A0A1M5EBS4_9BACI|nr:TetR/AcrR family transcriptional regulator [Ornithinibacillus halophilus]SHF76723.1 transcriptional regulator, TetR family [Ornithinibacillus halophilus]
MNEKKMNLIETGLTLFAEKGYHATSIQEIAKQAGISKGAFYLYFQSKEDFITTAISYFQTQIAEKMQKVKLETSSSKEALAKQINVIADYIYTYKGFITMFFLENISISDKTDTLMHEMKEENYKWMRGEVLSVYGEKVEPFLFDSVVQLEGLMSSYFKWIVLEEVQLDRKRLGDFIVKRLDNAVEGMLHGDEKPLMVVERAPTTDKQNITNIVLQLREKINILSIDEKIKSQLNEVVDEIANELNEENPKFIVIQGLLAHITRHGKLRDDCEKIASLLKIELLQ